MPEITERPPIVEGPGRYVIYQSPDGGWVAARALDLCKRCQECGCGDQAEPIVVPALVVKMAMQQGKGLFSKLKAMSGRG